MKFLANENFPRVSVLKLIEAKLDLTSIDKEKYNEYHNN